MFWKVFFGVLAALIVFWLIAWFFFGLAVWGVGSALEDQVSRSTKATMRNQQATKQRRAWDEYHALLRRSVCRNGKVYVPRKSGTVTYYDPILWNDVVMRCP